MKREIPSMQTNGSQPVTVSPDYQSLLRQQHIAQPSWGTHGHKWVRHVENAHEALGGTILDYGCGKGTLREACRYPVLEYDPGIPGKEQAEPADLVVCCDVLEHVEDDYIESVIQHIASLTQKMAFIVVHCGPAMAVLPDGRNAHLIQQPGDWWLMAIQPYFKIREFKDMGHEAVLTGVPRGDH